jgi:hypothetical protein
LSAYVKPCGLSVQHDFVPHVPPAAALANERSVVPS